MLIKCLHPKEGYCENCTVDTQQIDSAIDQLAGSAWKKKPTQPLLKWIRIEDRLPEKTGIYPACSMIKERNPPEDWLDALCEFNAEAEKNQCKWQHSSGFYDNGITHWLELRTPEALINEDEE